MRYPILASFLIFVIVVQYAIRKARNKNNKSEKDFWKKEAEANSVRRKPLDDVEYINIPIDELPTNVLPEDETISDCVKQLKELSEQKIINLTGITNTDLKLKYGVANLTFLSECDERFTSLVQLLQKWADYLWEKGLQEPAVTIMEYEISIRADVGAAYRKLAKYYRKSGQEEKIEYLIEVAEGLQSASSKSIVRSLKES